MCLFLGPKCQKKLGIEMDDLTPERVQGALDYGHECVIRQRVRQKAINEGGDPEYALLQREYFLLQVQTTQIALDAQ